MASSHMGQSFQLQTSTTVIGLQSSSKCCDTWEKKLSIFACVWSYRSHVFTKLIAISIESIGASSNSMFGSTLSRATRTSAWAHRMWG